MGARDEKAVATCRTQSPGTCTSRDATPTCDRRARCARRRWALPSFRRPMSTAVGLHATWHNICCDGANTCCHGANTCCNVATSHRRAMHTQGVCAGMRTGDMNELQLQRAGDMNEQHSGSHRTRSNAARRASSSREARRRSVWLACPLTIPACYAVLCYDVLCCAMLCYAMMCYAMLCCAMLCYAVLCCAMLCYAVLCCAMLCYAMRAMLRMLCCGRAPGGTGAIAVTAHCSVAPPLSAVAPASHVA
jgi:hypothetical protein